MATCWTIMNFSNSFFKKPLGSNHSHDFLTYSYTIKIWIPILSFQTFEFWPYFYKKWNSDCILSLVFWPYPLKHLNTGPISINICFLTYPSKHWNTGSVSIYIGIMTLSFQILEFWPYFYTQWNSDLILSKIGILALSLKALEF